jgi:hypothetical protein
MEASERVVGCTQDSTTGYQLVLSFLETPQYTTPLSRVYRNFIAARRRALQMAKKYTNARVRIIHGVEI